MGEYLTANEEMCTILLTVTLLTESIIACPGPWHDKSMHDAVWTDFHSYGNVSYMYIGKPLRSWSEAQEACTSKDSKLATPTDKALSNSKSPWGKLLKDLQEDFYGRAIQAPWTSVRQVNDSWQTEDGDNVDSAMWVMPPLENKTPSNESSDDPDSGRCAFFFVYSPSAKGSYRPSAPAGGLLDGQCNQLRATLCVKDES